MSQADSGKIKEFSQSPHGPAGKLRRNDHPDSHVKPAFFRSFIARGSSGARREIEDCGKNNERGQRIVQLHEEIVDDPATGEKVDGQADQVDGKRYEQVDPSRGVANYAIPKVRLGLTVMSD